MNNSKLGDSNFCPNFHNSSHHHLNNPNAVLQFQLAKSTSHHPYPNHAHNFHNIHHSHSSQSNNFHVQHQLSPHQHQTIQTAILIPQGISLNSFNDNNSHMSADIHQNGYQNHHHHNHNNNPQLFNNHDHNECNNNYDNDDEHNQNSSNPIINVI